LSILSCYEAQILIGLGVSRCWIHIVSDTNTTPTHDLHWIVISQIIIGVRVWVCAS